MDSQRAAGTTNSNNVYFLKLVFFAFLPVLLAAGDILFWIIYLRIKHRHKKEGRYDSIKNDFIVTLVILLFLVHPNITKAMFSSFNCMSVEGVYYLREDIDYVCYEGSHLIYLLIISVPSIILWSIGIPLAVLFVLIKNKSVLVM